jgi:hypothetical protein
MFRAVTPPLLVIVAVLGTMQAPSLQPVEQELARLERAELREPGSRGFMPPDRDWLARARSQIDAYLQKNPQDAVALVLFARVGRFALEGSRVAECSPEHGCVLDSTFDDTPYHAALDRALSMRDGDAAAHFWKARLLADGRPVLRDGEFAVDVDTSQVLAHAERAVALEPRTARYREFLAVTLTDMGRFAEATALVRELERGKHPLHLILQDLAAVPVPDGAVLWPGHALYAAVGMNEHPPRFAAQTGRSWLVPLSREQLAAFYQRRWPGFRLFTSALEGAENQGDPVPSSWLQYFEADRRGRLQPARDSAFVTRLERVPQFSGVVMVVRQIRPGGENPGEQYPAAVAGKDALVEVLLVTGRKGP